MLISGNSKSEESEAEVCQTYSNKGGRECSHPNEVEARSKSNGTPIVLELVVFAKEIHRSFWKIQGTSSTLEFVYFIPSPEVRMS